MTEISGESPVDGAGRAGGGHPRGVEPLPVPAVPAIGPELSGLSEAHRAEDRAFLVEGGDLWIAGTESRPGFRIGQGSAVVATVRVDGLGTMANVLLFPGVARRQSVGPRGTVLETLVSSSRLPLVVAQWAGGDIGTARGASDQADGHPAGSDPAGSGRSAEGASSAPAPEKIVVELAAPGGDAASGGEPPGRFAVQRHGDHVIVEAEGRAAVVALSPPAAGVHTRPRSEGGVQVVFTPSRDGAPSLLLATGSPDRIRTSIAAGAHTPAHATRAAAGPQDGLSLRSGVAEIDDGFLWLRSRLAGQARRATSSDVALGLAAVGVGDRDSAERILALGEPSSALHALVAARCASVLGDTGPAARVADHWRAHGPPDGDPLTGLAARSLAEALDHVSPPDLVVELRAMGGPSSPAAPGERRLPTLGGGPSEAEAVRWWRTILAGDPSGPVTPHRRRAVVEAREACAAFPTAPDEAWVTWRRLVSSTSEHRGATALWDPLPDARPDAPRGDETRSDEAPSETATSSLTAQLVLAIVHGLLGIRADAAVGRLRLAPRLPSHVHSFGVAGIPLGGSSLGMTYRRDDTLHRFELLPERASVPPLIVFEPWVPGSVHDVRIDGEAAELETEMVEGRTKIPVQLPVDRPRTVEIRI